MEWLARVGRPCSCSGFGGVAWARDCVWIHSLGECPVLSLGVLSSPPHTHHFPANLPATCATHPFPQTNMTKRLTDWSSSVSAGCITLPPGSVTA